MPIDRNNGALLALGAAGALAAIGAAVKGRKRGSRYAIDDAAIERAMDELREVDFDLTDKLMLVGTAARTDNTGHLREFQQFDRQQHDGDVELGWVFDAWSYLNTTMFDADLVKLYDDGFAAVEGMGATHVIDQEDVVEIVGALDFDTGAVVDLWQATANIITDH